MTEKQRRMVEYIQYFKNLNGFPPTIREIGKGIGVSSPASVKGMVDRLVEKGVLKRDALKARGIELIASASDVGIPLVGRIKAGHPVLSEEHIEGAIQVSQSLKECTDCFFLKVEGDSMQEKGIIEGDLVLIKTDKQIASGAVGAFRLNNEVTLKTFIQDDTGGITLKPENKSYSDIPVGEADDFEIIGRLVSVIRDLENIFDTSG